MMARLVCACFMHLQLYPEVKVTIEMMNYALTYHNKFKQQAQIPLLLCLFKIIGALGTCLGASYLIVQAKEVKWCIIAIFGMSIVSQISYFMAMTVTNVSISKEI